MEKANSVYCLGAVIVIATCSAGPAIAGEAGGNVRLSIRKAEETSKPGLHKIAHAGKEWYIPKTPALVNKDFVSVVAEQNDNVVSLVLELNHQGQDKLARLTDRPGNLVLMMNETVLAVPFVGDQHKGRRAACTVRVSIEAARSIAKTITNALNIEE